MIFDFRACNIIGIEKNRKYETALGQEESYEESISVEAPAWLRMLRGGALLDVMLTSIAQSAASQDVTVTDGEAAEFVIAAPTAAPGYTVPDSDFRYSYQTRDSKAKAD